MAQAWTYDSVSLGTLGYDVKRLGAGASVPARRGENVLVPGTAGRVHVAKVLDERTVTLAMWVSDAHPTTGVRSEAQMLANLDTLRGLFARSGQRTLQHTQGGVVRQALAEVISEVDFEPQNDDTAYYLAVEFRLAGALWYATTATTVGPTTINTSPKTITVANAGTYESTRAVLTLAGPLTNPKLAIGSTWVQYSGAVAGGETLVIDCSDWTAELDSVDVSGAITHAGALCWLPIPSGSNTLTVTSDVATTGMVTVAFYAPFV